MSDDNDQPKTNKDYQAVPGTDCLTGIESLDDIFKDLSSSTFTLPPLTGGSMVGGLGSITVNTATTTGSYNSNYNYPYISPTTPPSTSATSPQYNYNMGNYSWGQTTLGGINNSVVKITDQGLDLAENCDIKIGGQSLKTFMKTISERLAILQPDPAKLEKFEALKMAYEHYKTLEALCCEDDRKEDK